MLRALSPAGIERTTVRRLLLTLVLSIAPFSVLTGCGLKGDLYIADDPPAAAENDANDDADDDAESGA